MSLPLLSQDEFNANRGAGSIAADVVPRVFAILAVGLRFYARRIGGSQLSWDDWLILAVAIIFIPAIAVEIKMMDLGLGRHLQWVLANKPEGLSLYAKLAYFDQLIYAPMIAPIKCSILFLYIRIFGMRKSMRWVCLSQIALVVIWALITFFLFVFQCRPVQVAWSSTRTGGTCFQYAPLFIGTNTVNVIMDFGILVTPLPSIWQLNLPSTKKTQVSAVLMLGACGCIFSAIRLGVLSQLSFIDVTWDHADALIWSTLETAVGVLCACIPVMGPLLPRSAARQGKDSSNQGSNFKSYGSGVPRQGYSRFSVRSTSPEDPKVNDDEYNLMPTTRAQTSANEDSQFKIQRTVDWEVSSNVRSNSTTSAKPEGL